MRFSLLSYAARSACDNPPKTSSSRVWHCFLRSRTNSSSGVIYFMLNSSTSQDEGPTSTILFGPRDEIPRILYGTAHTLVFRRLGYLLKTKGMAWGDVKNDEGNAERDPKVRLQGRIALVARGTGGAGRPCR